MIKDGSTYVPITNSSGESVSLETSSSSDKGYSSSIPIAIENENGTDLNSDGDDYGYYIAISINGIYESEGYSSWQVLYTDSNGVIDDNSILSMNSITNKEQEFEQDLNGDNSIGIDLQSLDTISTDNIGDLLKKDSTGTYIIFDDNDTPDNDSDDFEVTLTYSDGSTPDLEDSYQDGTVDNLFTVSSIPYSVESYLENGEKEYLLVIKNETKDSYDNLTSSSFTTYVVSVDSNDPNLGVINSVGTNTKSLGPTESKLNIDLDGDNIIWSSATVTLSDVTVDGVVSDESVTGVATAAALKQSVYDSTLFITDVNGVNYVIVDSDNNSVTFDTYETCLLYTSDAADE